jgi:hypothetical protein
VAAGRVGTGVGDAVTVAVGAGDAVADAVAVAVGAEVGLLVKVAVAAGVADAAGVALGRSGSNAVYFGVTDGSRPVAVGVTDGVGAGPPTQPQNSPVTRKRTSMKRYMRCALPSVQISHARIARFAGRRQMTPRPDYFLPRAVWYNRLHRMKICEKR